MGTRRHEKQDHLSQISSANVFSIRLKNSIPPYSNKHTISALKIIGPTGGLSLPVSVQRNPSITPAIGLRL
jgi:hypothetical protein